MPDLPNASMDDVPQEPPIYDVIIVGGGPAGLSAALILGRCRRRVLVCDEGQPRNAATAQLHGYLSRDGIPPRQLLAYGREEVLRYGVEFHGARAVAARSLAGPGKGGPFEIALADGRHYRCRKLLLATGLADVVPEIEGMRHFYGRSVHHCPYCDGWEHRDEHLAAFGPGTAAVHLALGLRTWSERVTACTHGHEIEASLHQRLERNGIALRTERVVRLAGSGERLEEVVFERGPPLGCQALFFHTEPFQPSELAAMLGCRYTAGGKVRTEPKQRSGVPGLFLAGDVDGDVQFAIVAAAEGATAAAAINHELQEDERA